jgi:hypothetical protein
MSAAAEGKAEKNTRASGAKPRLGERVREHGWRPTTRPKAFALRVMEAARRRAIDPADARSAQPMKPVQGGRS